jgi:hypothetical protein
MPDKRKRVTSGFIDTLTGLLLSLPWLDILAEVLKVTKALWRGLADEGMYEVLEYESTLELKDRKGKRAVFRKREKVRYSNPTNGLPLLRRSPRKKQ